MENVHGKSIKFELQCLLVPANNIVLWKNLVYSNINLLFRALAKDLQFNKHWILKGLSISYLHLFIGMFASSS